MRQSIIWVNKDLVHWCIDVSPSHNELKSLTKATFLAEVVKDFKFVAFVNKHNNEQGVQRTILPQSQKIRYWEVSSITRTLIIKSIFYK